MKEATARIKINKLFEAAGRRFFPNGELPANIQLELNVKIKVADLDAFGNDFEETAQGFIDFLLFDCRGFPLIVLEAKSEDKNPLVGKEQARKYARSQNCRFVILSNGNLHYFWDLDRGNPYIITSFPTPESVMGYQKMAPDPKRLIEETVGGDYIVLTQRPTYAAEAGWKNEAERAGNIQLNKLRFLRPYQLTAIHALQRAVKEDRDRFLFEMATGTGKTLTAAAIIKLFLRSGNAVNDKFPLPFGIVFASFDQNLINKLNRPFYRLEEPSRCPLDPLGRTREKEWLSGANAFSHTLIRVNRDSQKPNRSKDGYDARVVF
jgi:type I restriction enzyme R subunit